jgi:predicted dehydrogenase
MKRMKRRDFLKHSAAGVAAPHILRSTDARGQESANDRLQVGCIGLGGMGRGDARAHRGHADIVAFCDVDTRQIDRAQSEHERDAAHYTDYRKVLERDDIDIVSVVTPDHWHVKIAIEALQAGKHVFCQKPLTLTLEENKLIRAACEKSDRTFFIGTQQRSTRHLFLTAIAMVKKGLLGDITKMTCGIGGGSVGGPFNVETPPAELDWDMWLGQAPLVDYRPQRCHGTFRWWYEYSGGKFTDWGAHHIDIAQWAIGEDELGKGPIEFDGTDANHPVPYENGHATLDHSYNSANDYAIKCTFASGVEMVVDSRSENGILFEGTEGRIFVSRGRLTGKPIEDGLHEQVTDEDIVELYKGKPFEQHKNNFYRCIREGGLPVSDVYSHVITMNSCHLCAIAARVGGVVKWDPKTETIVDNELAASLAARTQREGYEIPKV